MVQGHSHERGDCGLVHVPHCGKSLTPHFTTRYNLRLLRARGGAVWQLVGLITRRSEVQILSPQPTFFKNLQPISVGARCKGAAIRFACARYEASSAHEK